ncbi:hypothetical protein X777_14046 [Ooceraea biroi]|uniref:Uncharacterized protein n=1 Tax=Ooceraea biroi TaxID=2015173 RepID=A0A026VXJ7_OOCBI|nr:hypothetical protein X777_14046 [Ooceraea biroi]
MIDDVFELILCGAQMRCARRMKDSSNIYRLDNRSPLQARESEEKVETSLQAVLPRVQAASNNFLVRPTRECYFRKVTRRICPAKPSVELSQVFYTRSP